MIYLNPDNYRQEAETHKEKLKPKIKKRIEDNKPQLPINLKRFILNEIDKILTGKPADLVKINNEFNQKINHLKNRSKKRIEEKIRTIFNYDNFTEKFVRDYDAYDLAELLNLRTCTYCNRSYTITVLTKKPKEGHITRPQFDHYFPKKENPLLALSFYNLIPSCSICNSTLKGRTELDLSTHLHPYIDNCLNHFRFTYNPQNLSSAQGANNQHSILIKTDVSSDKTMADKIEATFDVFKIKETYNGHAEEVSDLLKIRNLMSDRYLEILKKTYKLNISDDELYRLAFGTYRKESEFHKRPFSKLKKDILKELGMI